MKDGKNLFVVLALFSVLIGCQDRLNTKTDAGKVTIVMPKEAAPQEQLAAKEIRRYLYLRTGELLPIVSADKQLPSETDLIVIGQKDQNLIKNLVARDAQLKTGIASLQRPEYKLKTISRKNRNIVLITGADTLATLYGAYHFIEHFGVRYYLHGDTIPDERITLKLPDIDETAKPLFDLRGVNPWGTHPFGFDLWNADDYKSIFSQLTKMRMNFLGLHCYPEGLPYAEPTVWIGLDGDFDADGDVKFSYPAVYYNTLWTTNWGPFWPKKTSDFSFGGSLLFDRDDWGADVMTGLTPQPTEPEKTNQLFNRTGRQFKDSFKFAKSLGVKTCVGTEAPLTIPKLVREKLIAKGADPKTPEVKRQVYESIFKRIMATHPLDYYWIWTSEAWLWSGNTEDQSNTAGNDFLIAHEAMKNVNAPFSLATAGWVLGPQDERSGFDRFLPKDIAVSTLSQLDSHLPINPDFDKIKGRGKWPIIWMEDDLALSNPQLWVGRTRKDAADALAYGCSGLMGLHWRTRAVSANISAMAKACWDQTPWNPTPGKVPAEKILKIPSSITRQQGKLLAGAIGGNPVSYIYVNPEIANTDDDTLYTTARYGMEGYNIEVPNGTYSVTLQFSEPQFDAAGKRVCSVKLQDKTVIDKLDIFAQAGKSTALDYTFEDVKVTDGWIKLGIENSLSLSWSLPCISAIAVQGGNFSHKINCGGPDYKDYVADYLGTTQIAWGPPRGALSADDFYDDWALTMFGTEAAEQIAHLFKKLDGSLPRPAAYHCPCAMLPDNRPWEKVAIEFEFVNELQKFRPKIKGPGNLERFDYWLNTFRYLRGLARSQCDLALVNQALEKIDAEKDAAKRKLLAKEHALPLYKNLLKSYGLAYRHLMATVSTKGALVNVINLEQEANFWPIVVDKPAKKIAEALGEDLPPDAVPAKTYDGPVKIIVPTVRTHLTKGESLNLNIILLSNDSPVKAALFFRTLGADKYEKIELTHLARATYSVAVPAEKIKNNDFEYHIKAVWPGGIQIYFPATAPKMNQTIVVN